MYKLMVQYLTSLVNGKLSVSDSNAWRASQSNAAAGQLRAQLKRLAITTTKQIESLIETETDSFAVDTIQLDKEITEKRNDVDNGKK